MVTSDPLSRCVGGLPLLKEAGPESPLEWRVWLGVGGQMLYVKSPRESVPPPTDGFRAKGLISGPHGNLLHQ